MWGLMSCYTYARYGFEAITEHNHPRARGARRRGQPTEVRQSAARRATIGMSVRATCRELHIAPENLLPFKAFDALQQRMA